MKDTADLLRAYARSVLAPAALERLSADLEDFIAQQLAAGMLLTMEDAEFTVSLNRLVEAGPDPLRKMLGL